MTAQQKELAVKTVLTALLEKGSSKEIEPTKLDKLFGLVDMMVKRFGGNPVEIAETWFKKYTDDATEARRRLKHLASGMSESEFAALVG